MHVPSEMFLLPAKDDDTTVAVGKIPALSTTVVEPIGRWFEAFCLRRRHKQTLSQASIHSSSSEEEEDDFILDEENEDLLRTLDPKEWKSQDHYAVLGLSKLRWRATEDQIKRAYKQKVLTHHPDKRKARGLKVKEGDDDYFSCITRAYEQLNTRDRKRSFDSVDPTFDDSIPSTNESKENFYKRFGPVFECNMRWSIKKKVPLLGDENSTYDEINHFYSFWYDFQSWREFSYLDEEEKEKGENRDERRWIEKQNKSARQKRKKEEVMRIRQLVDNAYSQDPRIARFREEEKAQKAAQKKAKQDMFRAKKEEEERQRAQALEEERKRKEKEEEEVKAAAAAIKKEKEAQKKALKKERKTLRTKLKEFDYFADDEAQRVNHMQEVEKLAEGLTLLNLQAMNTELTSGDHDRAKAAFLEKVSDMNEELEREKREHLASLHRSSSASSSGTASGKPAWSEQETQLLIKAVNLFPAGTVHRWEVVSNFITQHMPESKRSAKEVLLKAKSLQNPDTQMKDEVNKKAFDRFAQSFKVTPHIAAEQVASERFDTVAEQQVYEMGTNPAPWTAEEQKKLEQALRTFPANTTERWEKISEVLPNRSKKDCMMRYKELVETIRAKKAAQAAAAKKK